MYEINKLITRIIKVRNILFFTKPQLRKFTCIWKLSYINQCYYSIFGKSTSNMKRKNILNIKELLRIGGKSGNKWKKNGQIDCF